MANCQCQDADCSTCQDADVRMQMLMGISPGCNPRSRDNDAGPMGLGQRAYNVASWLRKRPQALECGYGGCSSPRFSVVVGAAILAYGLDYAVFRLRAATNRNAYGSVTVNHYYAVLQKNGKTQFIFDPPQAQTCVNALFPHSGMAAVLVSDPASGPADGYLARPQTALECWHRIRTEILKGTHVEQAREQGICGWAAH